MKNTIVRYETCEHCERSIPIWDYAPWNDDDRVLVLKDGYKIAICTQCWNKLVNFRIQFGPRGWEWVELIPQGRI